MRGTERVLRKLPLNFQLHLIVARRDGTKGPVRAADSAGRPQGSPN